MLGIGCIFVEQDGFRHEGPGCRLAKIVLVDFTRAEVSRLINEDKEVRYLWDSRL